VTAVTLAIPDNRILSSSRSGQLTILVVDDQATTRAVVKQTLLVSGYDVLEAASGEKLEIAEANVIDGIILDLKMPGIAGIETCRRLRAMQLYQATPILVVTAMEEREALTEAFEAGCDDYIAKPIEPIVLQTRLKGHLHRAELYHQLEGVRRNLNRYISPRTQKMVEQYTCTGQLPPPERLDVCMLFTDIRGFTQLSQEIEPEHLFNLLSKHLARQVEFVYQYGGYVDKYAGDGIMAIFEGTDKARRGCESAVEIVNYAEQSARKEQDHQFAIGCGLHQGPVVIGNIGSPDHLDYSVIGESVNLAARLCGFAKPMSIVVSDVVHDLLAEDGRFAFASERHVAVKGYSRILKVYDLEAAGQEIRYKAESAG
jgi:adenylate cyclase